jgi:hypothetical protein
VHSEIAAVPDERLAAECQLLAPLPSLRPEIGAASVQRKVDRLSCVRYGSARYSVPTRLIGTSVNIVIDHGALLVIEAATGVIVAEHELVAPGETSILDEHYDGPRPAPNRGPRSKTTVEHQFCALGEQALTAAPRRAVAFKRFRAADVRSILAAGTGPLQARPAGDALVLDLPTAPPRSLDAYKITATRDGSAS